MSATGLLFQPESPFQQVKDGHPAAVQLYERHYSARPNRNSKQIVGPYASLLLLTHTADALVVWRKSEYEKCLDPRTGKPQEGVNCAVFRNEGRQQSSALLLEAERIALRKWPGSRLYTYVNPALIANKRNPGYCFKMAGWRPCGTTKGNLLILEKLQPPC